jgi:hypothetical protein
MHKYEKEIDEILLSVKQLIEKFDFSRLNEIKKNLVELSNKEEAELLASQINSEIFNGFRIEHQALLKLLDVAEKMYRTGNQKWKERLEAFIRVFKYHKSIEQKYLSY